jgi:hypothetical protein
LERGAESGVKQMFGLRYEGRITRAIYRESKGYDFMEEGMFTEA